ncbi:MAG: GntP family permease [Planctomycetota bacterium]
MTIWWLVVMSVLVVLIGILLFRLHAFLTLLVAGLLVATFTGTDALRRHADRQVASAQWTDARAASFIEQAAVERLAESFGTNAGKIGILIALASIIGSLLSESGAAATIVRCLLAFTGPKRAPEALAMGSFVLAIPVFFDTVFYLMLPIARSLRQIVGKNYVLFLLAILAGGSIAHSLVPPTPGPLQVAELLSIDVGVMLLAGLGIGSVSSVVSLAAARGINYFVDVPLRETDDAANPSPATEPSDVSQPGLFVSVVPILVPVILITAASLTKLFVTQQRLEPSILTELIIWFGNKNIAIGCGLVLCIPLIRWITPSKRRGLVNASLASAGNIILITAAGGAFGRMLYHAGIADAVESLVDARSGLILLPIAFLVTTAIRTLQGSATVAMITSAGVLQGLALSGELPFHPVYLALAIGAGSKPISWMTDSAFWIITRMTGMTETEGLKVISTMSIALGFSALSVTVLAAWVFPLR